MFYKSSRCFAGLCSLKKVSNAWRLLGWFDLVSAHGVCRNLYYCLVYRAWNVRFWISNDFQTIFSTFLSDPFSRRLQLELILKETTHYCRWRLPKIFRRKWPRISHSRYSGQLQYYQKQNVLLIGVFLDGNFKHLKFNLIKLCQTERLTSFIDLVGLITNEKIHLVVGLKKLHAIKHAL